MISDALYADAVRLTYGAKIASTSLLQLACRISYSEAVQLIDRMETDGIVGPAVNAAPRPLLNRSVPIMQLQTVFDARQVEPAAFAPPPPLADYHVRITDSEGKPTSDQTGGYLELSLEILDPGPHLNRKIPYRLNLFSAKNPQTVEIAYRQLSAVCYVTGVFTIQDSRQLHNIPFIATIGPQANNPQYANVFAVKDINGNLPGKTPAAAGVTAAPVAAAPPAWAPPAPAAAAAPAPPAWGAPAPAQPPAPPAWGAQPPAAAPTPPVWTPPGAPAAPAVAAAPWQPAGAPAAPPWAK